MGPILKCASWQVLGQRVREAEFGNYVFLVIMTVDEKKKKKQ